MTTNEIITIVISSGALFIALLTLYLTYFHKRAALIGILTGTFFETARDTLLEDYSRRFEYAFSNTGNLQLLLKEVKIMIEDPSSFKGVTGYNIVDSASPNIPMVIESGHVSLIQLSYMSDLCEKAEAKNQKYFTAFTIISSRGKVYEIRHNLNHWEEDNTEASRMVWKPFKLNNAYFKS